LERHDPSEATETLGIWQAVDGNNIKQIAQLWQKTEDFADSMRTGYLSKNDAWYAINTTIINTFEYPMTATTIRKKEWESIMVPLLKAGLPRAGISSKFPRDILYGPTTVQGFGVFHPWYHQQLKHLIVLLEHTEHHSMTGQFLTTSFEQLRLETGTSGFMTDTQYTIMKATVTQTWITDLWAFLNHFSIQLRDDIAQLPPRRKNDKFLMNEFINSGNHLKKLNECRMFLNAVTISDIATANGKELALHAWNGTREDRGPSTYQWPRIQDSLLQEHWKQWQRAIASVFLLHDHSRVLDTPLLEWNTGELRQWKWHFSQTEDQLYAKEGLQWRIYRQHRSRTSPRQGRAKYSKTTQLSRMPPVALQLATVFKQGSLILLHGIGSGNAGITTPLSTATSFEAGRLLRASLDQWAIHEIIVTDEGIVMAQAL
jgi:hypothetical protein